MLSVNATVCGWVKTVTFTNNINNRNMNNLKNGSHRIEKDMLKSIVGETFLTNIIKSEELGLTSYNYEYCDVKAHVIEEYPIPISVGKNKVQFHDCPYFNGTSPMTSYISHIATITQIMQYSTYSYTILI